MSVVNLTDKLSSFSEHWSPKIVAGFNGHDVMVVKVKGEFVWHAHPDTDDLFLVLSGRLTIGGAMETSISAPASCTWCHAGWSIARSRKKRRLCR